MAEAFPTVEVRFRADPANTIEVADATHGMAVAPAADGRLTVSAFGTDAQVLQMALAVFDFVRLSGLENALMIALAQGVGRGSAELQHEHFYEVPTTQEG